MTEGGWLSPWTIQFEEEHKQLMAPIQQQPPLATPSKDVCASRSSANLGILTDFGNWLR